MMDLKLEENAIQFKMKKKLKFSLRMCTILASIAFMGIASFFTEIPAFIFFVLSFGLIVEIIYKSTSCYSISENELYGHGITPINILDIEKISTKGEKVLVYKKGKKNPTIFNPISTLSFVNCLKYKIELLKGMN